MSNAIVEHAGSGLRMPEATARRIENLSRGLPHGLGYKRLSTTPDSFSCDAGSRTDVSTISTPCVDRDRECVLPEGGDWSGYNNVVPFAHNYAEMPVGSCVAMKTTPGAGIVAKTHYPSAPPDWQGPWLPSAVLHLMQQPVPTCTGKSIGFLALHRREPTREEIARRPEMAGATVTDRWAGIEYSVVPVPCNAEAEMIAVAKGFTAGVVPKWLRDELLKVGGRYAHIDFTAPLGVREGMKSGLWQHRDYNHDCASPEVLAMARHLMSGGKASPAMLERIAAYYAGPGAIVSCRTAPARTPARCMFALHGAGYGKNWSAGLLQTMRGALQ